MAFKIIKQRSSWFINGGTFDLHSKEILPENGFTEYKFKMTSKDKPDDFLAWGGLVLVSDKILNILSDYKDDIEASFTPVTLLWNEVNYSSQVFYILEVFNDLKCINHEESKYKFFSSTNRIMSLYELVVYPIDTKKHKLFTIDDTCFLCVADCIADEFVKQGCTGFKLIDTSDATI
jgi:hypothetical protein